MSFETKITLLAIVLFFILVPLVVGGERALGRAAAISLEAAR